MTTLLTDTLDRLKSTPERLAEAAARVESQPDPRLPGRTAYRITGPSSEAVQAAITDCVNAADDAGGRARFIGPHRLVEGGYRALGEVVIQPGAAHAA